MGALRGCRKVSVTIWTRAPMSALSRFESFMENIVEGSVARLFRSPVQPAEIAKRLERAMEANQQISVRRVIVPNL
ncbi:MAG TPA: FhaA domain-containing protein, partial [Roseiflexaceae bacterium]|nr:FhaA domain-containing protein [Roseiflexaceae bacterium]